LKTFYEKGDIVVFRGETHLSEQTIEAMRGLLKRSLAEFATFLELQGRTEEQHHDFRRLLEEQRLALFPDAGDASELDYFQLIQDLDDRGINFISIATYLTVRLQAAVSEGEIALGVLEDDLVAFKSRTVTLDELGDRLQTLDERWEFLNSSPLRPVRGL
jgi:hypothetical protein